MSYMPAGAYAYQAPVRAHPRCYPNHSVQNAMNRLATYFRTFAAIFTLALWASSPALAQVEIEVAAGDSTILAAVAQANPGDILVLTTDGGLYTNLSLIHISEPTRPY